MNPIEATVTKLLVATKQLLESLTLWSNRKVSEEHVSDIFVQLATQFNLASQAFHEVGIDTRYKRSFLPFDPIRLRFTMNDSDNSNKKNEICYDALAYMISITTAPSIYLFLPLVSSPMSPTTCETASKLH